MKLLAFILATCLLLPAACTAAKLPVQALQPAVATTVPAALPDIFLPGAPIEVVPVLTAEAFESGELTLDTVSVAGLELFLQDLNRRKDYDYSQHDNQAGPDAEYLWDWVQKVTVELKHRGYTVDDAGDLFRPDGTAIPMR